MRMGPDFSGLNWAFAFLLIGGIMLGMLIMKVASYLVEWCS